MARAGRKPKQALTLNTKGVKPLLEKLRALKDVAVSQEVAKMLGDEGNGFRKLAYQTMRANNWPSETLKNGGFVDARWPQSKRGKGKVSILFGFSKQRGPGYVEWYGKPQGRTIGMSLLTLYEFGGEHRPASPKAMNVWLPARPAWRPAIKDYRKTARANIRAAIDDILIKRIGEIPSEG